MGAFLGNSPRSLSSNTNYEGSAARGMDLGEPVGMHARSVHCLDRFPKDQDSPRGSGGHQTAPTAGESRHGHDTALAAIDDWLLIVGLAAGRLLSTLPLISNRPAAALSSE